MKPRDVLLVLAGGAIALVIAGVVMLAVDGDTTTAPTPTETIVVALVVGSFGGLLGAALGPFLGHVFNGWQRKDIRSSWRSAEVASTDNAAGVVRPVEGRRVAEDERADGRARI